MPNIICFGRLSDMVANGCIDIDWQQESRNWQTLMQHIDTVSHELAEQIQQAAQQRSSSIQVAINQRLVSWDSIQDDTPINDRDEIAFMPPVTGG